MTLRTLVGSSGLSVLLLACAVGCGNGSSSASGAGGAPTTASGTSTGQTAAAGTTSGSPGATTSAGTTGGGDAEPTKQTGMTAAHNAVRANVSPAANPSIPPLVWSSAVASVAQAYASKCVFQHSGGAYGENIYATSGSATPKDVVTSWASEASNYDYAANTCSKVCGHYTQVVWRDSVKLGCGVADCTTGSPFGGGAWQFWVCNYDPPGNFNGTRPY